MPDLKSQLKVLLQLQNVDSQIYALNEEKNNLPKEIEAFKAAFEDKKKRLAELEKVALENQKAKKDAESELAAKEEVAKKFQGQLYSLKTNKEYNTMQQQIQDAKADASRVEDTILLVMEKIEESRKDIDAEKKKLGEDEKIFNEQKKKAEARLKEIEDKLAVMGAQRKALLPGIENKILSHYDRILHNREGLAIVEVKNSTCMGCNMFVPAQVENLIKMYEKINTCGVCSRILFIADEQT